MAEVLPAPLFTVILPTFNRSRYIRGAIDSVISQTWQDWELLILDDGSAPPVHDHIASYLANPKITYHYHAHQGLGATRQIGVGLARGEYVCFLDDDDFLLPPHLNVIQEEMKRRGRIPALYKTGMIRLDLDGTTSRSTLFDQSKSMPVQHWTYADGMFPYAVPRHVALEVPSIQYYFSEDFNWVGRLMVHLPVFQIPVHTVVFRWHGGNRTNAITDEWSLTERQRAVDELYHYPGVADQIPYALYRKMMVHQALHYARLCIRQNKFGPAGKGFRQAIAYFHPKATYELVYTTFYLVRQLVTRSISTQQGS